MSARPTSSEPKLRVLSLGAGVQSTTMALMAAHGEIDQMPDCAIFADTGWEPRAVYDHLAWISSGVLPFPIHVVSAGNIREDAIARTNTPGQRFAAIPWYTVSPAGRLGMGRRQCTKEYKLRPIQRKVGELLGGRMRGGAEVWIGISADEVARMKPSRVGYIVNRFPLVERWASRRDCLTWLCDCGYPEPPRSACIGCPFRSNAEWRMLPDYEFADVVEVDSAIRHQPGFRHEQYAHASRKPLGFVDLSTAEERGQLNLFNNECDGLCGV